MAYVIILAQEEACLMGHRHIWTHQILLGLIRERISTASRVLRSMGINLEDARDEVEEILGLGNGFGGDNISLARRARRAYELRIRQHEEMQEWWDRNGIVQQANIPFAQMSCELSLEEARQLGQGSGFAGRGVFIPLMPGAQRLFALSLEEARRLGHDNVRSEHLLLTLLREGVAARVLQILGADLTHIRTEMIRILRMEDESMEAVGGSGQKMPMLDMHGTNLTELAKEGKLDPVVGRQEQIERVTQILNRHTKNNPCLIGEPGVGKTAIAKGLAQRIATGDVPETVEGKKIITLEKFLLVARAKYLGGYCGEFEEQLKKLMEEIKQAEDIILFIGEVHTLIGTRASEGVANIFRSALASGELQCIGATTLDAYRKHIKKDPALERIFQPVKVPEPTVDETIQILKGLRQRYEILHNLRYTDEALVAAAQLSYQYISDWLPAKAIDLIDEAGSHVRHKAGELRDGEVELRAQMAALINKDKAIEAENKAEETGLMVAEADIQHIVSSWTGIPVEKVSSESSRLLRMEETLHSRIIGQDEAVKAISRAIHRSRVWPKNPNRLIASFIFSGPTGVGKSDLAKALASFYFGSEEAMIQLDMSEFMESHTVSKLIGSPPGYMEGGQLTEAVRIRPYTVVLFDKIEKAHPDVFNMILQILEDGQLTDSKGRTVDFKNTLLIMTSNMGSSVIEKGGRKIRFDHESADKKDRRYNRIKSLITEELKQYFCPEFLNRLDEMIVFRQLTKLEAKEIADIMLKELISQQKKNDIDVQFTDRFRDRVVDEGYNPSNGARPLRKTIMRFLGDSLMRKVLGADIKKGNSVIVDVDSEGKVVVLRGESGKEEEVTEVVPV